MTATPNIETAFTKAVYALSSLDKATDAVAAGHIHAAITKLLARMPASRDTLRKILFFQNADVLKSLLIAHGAEPYRRIQQNADTRVSLTPLYAEQCVEMLRSLHSAGISVIEEQNTLSVHLTTISDLEMLEFFLIEVGRSDLVFNYDAMAALRTRKGPAGAVVGKAFLNLDPDAQERVTATIIKSLATLMRAKPLALALLSGFDVAQMFEKTVALKFLQPPVLALVNQTRSAHGRMALRAMEPDLCAVMARPNDATFFGLSDRELRA